MRRTGGIGLGLLGLAIFGTALGGCHNATPDEPAATENVTANETSAVEPTNKTAPVVHAPSVTSNAAAAVDDRPDPAAPDSQTIDDADATGMTSRVHRGDSPANEASAP